MICALLYLILTAAGTDATEDLDPEEVKALLEFHRNIQMKAITKATFSKYLFQVLDNVTAYDGRVRPQLGGDPVSVKVQLYVQGLGPLSIKDMSMYQDVYMTQYWKDARLAAPKSVINITEPVGLSQSADVVEKLWKPDTYFRNTMTTEIVRTHNDNIGFVLKIDTDGNIRMTRRIRVKSSCPMFINYFPFDQQLCELEIGSFSFDQEDIIFKWGKDPIKFNEVLAIPQFSFIKESLSVRQFQIQSMENSQTILVVQYLFKRGYGLYIIQVYVPAVLIVFVSWVTFWINREAVPARASLGITCVLTMITLTGSCLGNLPSNHMYTPVDVFLISCFLFVFGALLEFAFVHWHSSATKTKSSSDASASKHLIPMKPNGVDLEETVNTKVFPNEKKPLDLDHYSRMVYPFIFVGFNLFYWVFYLVMSENFNEKVAGGVSERALTN